MAFPADNKWLSLENLPLLLLSTSVRNLDTSNILHIFPIDKIQDCLHREDDRNRPYDYRHPIEYISPIDEIGIPLAFNWIQLLCGLGMLEIAYDSTAKLTDVPQHGMHFVRLTPLGRFAFGLTAKYTPQEVENKAIIEYDAENGIITDSTPNSPYTILLSKISTPIGYNRYLLTARSVARDCKTPKEVNDHLDMIRQLVDEETQKAMLPIFINAQQRLNCGQLDEGYDLITIRPELDELRQLLANNPNASKLVAQLGRNKFLVKHSDLFKLNAILAAEGFRL